MIEKESSVDCAMAGNYCFVKKKIESIIKSLNISYIDIVQEFEKEEDPINFYPFGIRGHFTTDGYRLIAESIFKNIIK